MPALKGGIFMTARSIKAMAPVQISLIAAMANHRVIGKNNQLPWHLPADLQHFKALTLNKPVVMGRKTYASIGKPLPQRTNIVLTSDLDYQAPGCEVVHSLDEVSERTSGFEEVFIIGGASVYRAYFPLAHRLYLTIIHADFDGDAFFPDFDASKWRLISQKDCFPDEKNRYAYSFLLLESLEKLIKLTV
jgi:dihydrofolate reductase